MDTTVATAVAAAVSSPASAAIAVTVATHTALSVSAWLQVLLLGALAGAMGQVIRQIASLKRILDNNPGDRLSVLLDQTRIVVNLLIGATAGLIGTLSLDLKEPVLFDTKTILSLVGFGYAGADFIESFMRKAEPPKPADPAAQQTPTSQHTPSSSTGSTANWPIPEAKG